MGSDIGIGSKFKVLTTNKATRHVKTSNHFLRLHSIYYETCFNITGLDDRLVNIFPISCARTEIVDINIYLKCWS